MMAITSMEREVLRELAKGYAEIASLQLQQEKKKLWVKLNQNQMERPMVLIDQIPWNEMDVDGVLVNKVSDPYWREVETSLRQTIYKWTYMPADMVVNAYITLPRPINVSSLGIDRQVDVSVTDESNSVKGQYFHNSIHSLEDVKKIKLPTVTLDTVAEKEIIQTGEEMWNGIIPFKMTGQVVHLGLWDLVSQVMGVENCYIQLMDDPELMHAVMEKLTVCTLHKINQMNALGLFDVYSNVCHCSHTFGEEAGVDLEPISKNAWAFGMAQLFTSVSPATTAEFEVPYMQRLFSQFGSIYYGCCDRLDDRLEIVDRMPNIKKISCSPWSDREKFADKLPKKYIMSNKPHPAYLASVDFDEAIVRNDLRKTIDAAKRNGIGLEMILKDISTVRYDPKRLWRWSEIALEEVCR